MAKYRKRVPTVEAFQWDGGKELWPTNPVPKWVRTLMRSGDDDLIIDPVFGYRLVARIGDWIVVYENEARIVRDREFVATYEPVEEDCS